MQLLFRSRYKDVYTTYGPQITVRQLIEDVGGDPKTDLTLDPPDAPPGTPVKASVKNMRSFRWAGPLIKGVGEVKDGIESVGHDVTEACLLLMNAALYPSVLVPDGTPLDPQTKDFLSMRGSDGELRVFLLSDEHSPEPDLVRKKGHLGLVGNGRKSVRTQAKAL